MATREGSGASVAAHGFRRPSSMLPADHLAWCVGPGCSTSWTRRRARLTLVMGSPGAGKTALLADWLAADQERPAAWLSCDRADAEPARFVAGMIEALRRVCNSRTGRGRPPASELDGEVSPDVIAALADDLDGLDGPQLLVLDDFHLTGAGGADIVTLLLECRPALLQLVLASRVRPGLRLNRMRANEELVDLDQDLSFSAEETGLSSPDSVCL